MARRSKNEPPPDPVTLAENAANRYFAALRKEIPFDTAPGDADLIAAVIDIHDAVKRTDPRRRDDDSFDAAYRAGYLLGVEIGRRMGGAR